VEAALTSKIVVLAAGRGTRMQAPGTTDLSEAQAAAADAGAKAMIPIDRPFLDYALSAFADAGLLDVCLVIGPTHRAIREHYAQLQPRRVRMEFAIQLQPIGVANAVLAAREFVGEDDFIVANGDNYYPTAVMARLREMSSPALPAFSREGLLREAQIEPQRIAAYALLDIAPDGTLRRIVEKPTPVEAAAMPDARVSLNSWLFTPQIFEACARVPKSARGEYELPAAVQLAIDALGMRFHTFPAEESVLDLSSRGDIPGVASRLRGMSVQL
jgi:dTDP-glucose pyrophosphorylase